ncbi:MAG: DUF2946 domain-containing protein [Alphaproteobacteria bacterium]|nr:DUF2946 domain-containing protein [Alphaproteobacteria bacterium]
MNRFRISSSFSIRPYLMRRAVIVVALLAVICQFLIPAGFMPNLTGSGKTALVICSGMGEKTIFVDTAGSVSDQTPVSEHPGDTCPYFLAQGGTHLTSQPVLPQVMAFTAAKPLITALTFTPSVRFLLPEARGSPVFA